MPGAIYACPSSSTALGKSLYKRNTEGTTWDKAL